MAVNVSREESDIFSLNLTKLFECILGIVLAQYKRFCVYKIVMYTVFCDDAGGRIRVRVCAHMYIRTVGSNRSLIQMRVVLYMRA